MSARSLRVRVAGDNDEARELVLSALTPEERFSALFTAASRKERATNMGEIRLAIVHDGALLDAFQLKDLQPGLLEERLYVWATRKGVPATELKAEFR